MGLHTTPRLLNPPTVAQMMAWARGDASSSEGEPSLDNDPYRAESDDEQGADETENKNKSQTESKERDDAMKKRRLDQETDAVEAARRLARAEASQGQVHVCHHACLADQGPKDREICFMATTQRL